MTDRLEEIRARRAHPKWPTPHEGDWLLAEVDALRADNAEAHADKEALWREAERLRAKLALAEAVVAADAAYIRLWRGEPTTVTDEMLAVEDARDAALAAWDEEVAG